MELGCQNLIAQLYKTHFASMLKILKQSADNDYQAEDALQEAFALAWSKRDDVARHPAPVAWIVVTAQNKLKNAKRKDARLAKRLILLDENIAGQIGVTDEINIDLEYAGTVPKRELDMLKRVYVEGYKQEEIAEEFHISPNSAYYEGQTGQGQAV